MARPSAKLRFEPIGLSREIDALAKELTSPDFGAQIVAETARTLIAEADEINRGALGRVPPKEVRVNGNLNAPFETVRPGQAIVAEYKLIDDVIQYIEELLIVQSPYGSAADDRPGHPGLYSKSHVLLANDDRIEYSPGMRLPDADQFIFVNTQPYARKIERGLSSQSPDGVYQVVAAMASARFGNVAHIAFGYRAITFGNVSSWAQSASAAAMAKRVRGGRAALHPEWLSRQPAIIVSLYED